MIGFWENEALVETGHPDIKATAYIHEEKVLLSIGNFSDRTEEVILAIDWKQLGFGPENTILLAPEIEDFQEAGTFRTGDPISIDPRKGCLLYLEAI